MVADIRKRPAFTGASGREVIAVPVRREGNYHRSKIALLAFVSDPLRMTSLYLGGVENKHPFSSWK
jgi:hypothetical protein